jgi:hypothetical protein
VRIRWGIFSTRRRDNNVSDRGFNSSIMSLQSSITVPDSGTAACTGMVDEYGYT